MKKMFRRIIAGTAAWVMMFAAVSFGEEPAGEATPTDILPGETETEPTETEPTETTDDIVPGETEPTETTDDIPSEEPEAVPEETADREIALQPDNTLEGELNGNVPAVLKIRLTEDEDAEYVILLISDQPVKAVIRNETTGGETALAEQTTENDETESRQYMLEAYQTQAGSYMLTLSADSELETRFVLRIVTAGIYRKELEEKEREQARTAVSGSRIWDDKNNQDGKRPATVTVQLQARKETGEWTDVADRRMVLGSGDSDYEWTDLPVYEDGEELTYRVVETETLPAGYTVSGGTQENGRYDLTCSYTPETISIKVTAEWNDSANKDNIRPGSVTVVLLADGAQVGKAAELNRENNWSCQWNMLARRSAGREIKYTVNENPVPTGYTKKIKGVVRARGNIDFTITNSHQPKAENSSATSASSSGTTGASGGGSSVGLATGSAAEPDDVVYRVTVCYWFGERGGKPAAPASRVNHYPDETYMITSPQIPGYRADRQVIQGTTGEKDETYHVVYVPNKYTVTIEPTAPDGSRAADPVILENLRADEPAEVTLPDIPGYIKTAETLTVLYGTGDRTIRIVYLPEDEGYELIRDDDRSPDGGLSADTEAYDKPGEEDPDDDEPYLYAGAEYDPDHLTIGNPTRLSGNFTSTMWGGNPADTDVMELISGYSPIRYDSARGCYAANRTAADQIIAVRQNDTPDEITLIVTLNDRMQYSDGTPITAADYAFAILLASSPAAAEAGGNTDSYCAVCGADSYGDGEKPYISGVRLLNEHMLSLTVRKEFLPDCKASLARCYPMPIHIIAPGCTVTDEGDGAAIRGEMTADILEKTLLDSENGYLSHPAAVSGAYRLLSYDEESGVAELEANDAYLGNFEGFRPSIHRLTFMPAENETMIELLEDGEFGLLCGCTDDDAVEAGMELLEDPDYGMACRTLDGEDDSDDPPETDEADGTTEYDFYSRWLKNYRAGDGISRADAIIEAYMSDPEIPEKE